MSIQRPNVLVLFCDQFRPDLMGCYGGEQVRTPNLDALAAESLVFENAYTPTAICSPARASLLTGLYPHAHHMFNNSTPRYSYCEHLREDLDNLAKWIDRETSYESGYFGKWHIGPAEDLFSSAFHVTHPRPYEGGPGYLNNSHWHPNTRLGPLVKSLADGAAGLLDVPLERFPDVAAAAYTQSFMEKDRGDQSFVGVCAFPGPHSPWMIPAEFGLRHDPRSIPLWPNRDDSFAGKPINQRKLREIERQRKQDGDEALKERLACCFSYIELIDEQVGVLIDSLKRSGNYENTAILLTADHGDMAGSHGFLSKGAYMYDEIYRIPMLLKPPGGCDAERVKAPVHLMDATATVMHLMSGNEKPSMQTHALHGDSLMSFMEGEAQWPRRVHYAEYHGDWYGHYSSRMVTDGEWKLVWNLTDLCELYDLASDPHELNNLFYEDAYRSVRDRYFEQLMEESRRLQDGQVRPEAWEAEHAMRSECAVAE